MGDRGLAAAVFEPAVGNESGELGADSRAVLDGSVGGAVWWRSGRCQLVRHTRLLVGSVLMAMFRLHDFARH